MLPWDRGEWEDFLTRAWLGLFLPTATFISPCFLSVKHMMAMCKSVRSKLSLQKQTLTHTESLENLVLKQRHLRNTVLHFFFVLSMCCWGLVLVSAPCWLLSSSPALQPAGEKCSVSAMELPPTLRHVLGNGEHTDKGRSLIFGLLWEAVLEKDISAQEKLYLLLVEL